MVVTNAAREAKTAHVANPSSMQHRQIFPRLAENENSQYDMMNPKTVISFHQKIRNFGL